MLFTEHDMDVVFRHADRVIVLSAGELIAQGTPAEVRADAQVRREDRLPMLPAGHST